MDATNSTENEYLNTYLRIPDEESYLDSFRFYESKGIGRGHDFDYDPAWSFAIVAGRKVHHSSSLCNVAQRRDVTPEFEGFRLRSSLAPDANKFGLPRYVEIRFSDGEYEKRVAIAEIPGGVVCVGGPAKPLEYPTKNLAMHFWTDWKEVEPEKPKDPAKPTVSPTGKTNLELGLILLSNRGKFKSGLCRWIERVGFSPGDVVYIKTKLFDFKCGEYVWTPDAITPRVDWIKENLTGGIDVPEGFRFDRIDEEKGPIFTIDAPKSPKS